MKDPGEQCTVVFALIVTEPASECYNRSCLCPPAPLPHPPIAGSVIIHAKTTVHYSPGSFMQRPWKNILLEVLSIIFFSGILCRLQTPKIREKNNNLNERFISIHLFYAMPSCLGHVHCPAFCNGDFDPETLPIKRFQNLCLCLGHVHCPAF
jgi:hypothetical protein